MNNEYTKRIIAEIEKRKNQPKISYEDFYKKMDEIAVLNQMKRNYNSYKEEGYSNETAFHFAQKKTYEEYLQYMIHIIENRKLSNFKNVNEIKIGLQILKNEPQELYEYLDIYKYFKKNEINN